MKKKRFMLYKDFYIHCTPKANKNYKYSLSLNDIMEIWYFRLIYVCSTIENRCKTIFWNFAYSTYAQTPTYSTLLILRKFYIFNILLGITLHFMKRLNLHATVFNCEYHSHETLVTISDIKIAETKYIDFRI